jgi:hypothetical protein
MKLRIRGDSIRIRVTQRELREIADSGRVHDTIRFRRWCRPRPTRSKAMRPRATPQARYARDLISVVLPAATVQRWAGSNEVSIEGEQALGDGQTLRIPRREGLRLPATAAG